MNYKVSFEELCVFLLLLMCLTTTLFVSSCTTNITPTFNQKNYDRFVTMAVTTDDASTICSKPENVASTLNELKTNIAYARIDSIGHGDVEISEMLLNLSDEVRRFETISKTTMTNTYCIDKFQNINKSLLLILKSEGKKK